MLVTGAVLGRALACAHSGDTVDRQAAGSSGANDERPGEDGTASGGEYCNGKDEKQARNSVQGIV